MIVIEMKLAEELNQGTIMIALQHISEVEEMGNAVRLLMASGNSYVVTAETFHAALASIEGFSYLKFKTEEQIAAEAAAAEEVKEVEGELIPA